MEVHGNLGVNVSRYGLVVTLLLIGALKFTASEAQGIQPLVASSPLMFWLYRLLSVQGVSNLIGVIEIVVALLMASRPFSAKLSFIGSIGAIITFLLTVSFLFSTRGALHFSHGFPVLGDAGQFLIKDIVLLGSVILDSRRGTLGPLVSAPSIRRKNVPSFISLPVEMNFSSFRTIRFP